LSVQSKFHSDKPTDDKTMTGCDHPHPCNDREDVTGASFSTTEVDDDQDSNLGVNVDVSNVSNASDNFNACDVRLKLQNHQIHGLNWMTDIENADPRKFQRSGVLADDMGLGKTYQTSALFLVRKTSTLIVTTTATVVQWRDAIFHVTGIRPRILYGGNTCDLSNSATGSHELIAVTTYGTLESHVRKGKCSGSGGNTSGAHGGCFVGRHWGRIVLDEAHLIRNRKTLIFKAVMKLQSTHRWALTGTPVNNGLGDLQALSEWIQVPLDSEGMLSRHMLRRVFDDGVVVRVMPREEALRQSQRERELERERERERAPKRAPERELSHPSIETDYVPTRALPGMCTRIVELDFAHAHEREVYSVLERSYANKAASSAQDGTKNEAAMEAFLRLRQACVHASICVQGMQKKRLYNSSSMGYDDLAFLRSRTAQVAARGPSTKIDYVVDRIRKFTEEDGSTKTLVFCEWLMEMSVLDVAVRERLGVGCGCFSGRMSLMDKTAMLDRFRSDPDMRVLLIQIRTGGTGLNLQSASNVIITSPNWNPCVELQALCRAYRQGQTREVVCERVIVRNTVEVRCMDVQRKKMRRIDDLFADPAAMRHLGFTDNDHHRHDDDVAIT
jgi:transcription termination factor 2